MKALTANRLDDGEVVFWKAGAWVERFADAQLWEDGDGAADDAEAHGKASRAEVIDAYLIEIVPTEGGVAPLSYRERLRALGPTNHHDHGKQSEGGAVVEALLHASGAARSKGRVDLIKRK